MNTEKFELLRNVMKILERHSAVDPEITECCLDIVENWDSDLSAEQKAEILKDVAFLNRRNKHDENRFSDEDYRQHMRDFLIRRELTF